MPLSCLPSGALLACYFLTLEETASCIKLRF